MGDLAADTSVQPAEGDGRWRARLSEDWNVWGPNGGYVASICLRAAGATSGLARPATIACHYLAVAAFDEVILDVDVVRRTRRTAALHVRMTQAGHPIAQAIVWAVADALEGYEWEGRAAPRVPDPDDLDTAVTGHAMDRVVDHRRVDLDPAPISDAGPATHAARSWMRFAPTATFDDPWVDACRSLILVDTWAWPAAIAGVAPEARSAYVAPNLDVSARFHVGAADSPWLLADARAPAAAHGLIGTEVDIWSRDGRLVTSGGAQLLCRPWPSDA